MVNLKSVVSTLCLISHEGSHISHVFNIYMPMCKPRWFDLVLIGLATVPWFSMTALIPLKMLWILSRDHSLVTARDLWYVINLKETLNCSTCMSTFLHMHQSVIKVSVTVQSSSIVDYVVYSCYTYSILLNT